MNYVRNSRYDKPLTTPTPEQAVTTTPALTQIGPVQRLLFQKRKDLQERIKALNTEVALLEKEKKGVDAELFTANTILVASIQGDAKRAVCRLDKDYVVVVKRVDVAKQVITREAYSYYACTYTHDPAGDA